MGQKKKLSNIADAVQGILGNSVKKKKLKKAKALRGFIKKMETRRKEINDELDQGRLKKNREKMLRQHLETLDKQIKKAERILKDMDR